MESLLKLADDDSAEADLTGSGGLTKDESADVMAILGDVMAEGTVDAMLDTLVANDSGNPATQEGSAKIGDTSLTQTIDGSAFAFDAAQLADMSAEAAAVAASVG